MVWGGALLALAALLVWGLAAYGRLWSHDFADAFPRTLRRLTPWALAGFAAVALWRFGLGAWSGAALLAVGLAPYYAVRPRLVLAVCAGLSGLLLPAAERLSSPAGAEGERAWALYRAGRGDRGPALERELARLFPAGEREALRARARLARADGRYEDGLRLLRGDGVAVEGARLELGNLWFLRESLSEAAAEYRRAAAERPRDPAPWINLHLLELRRLALPAADEALEYARRLDPDADELLRAAESFPLSRGPDPSGVRERLLVAPVEAGSWGGRLRQAFIGVAGALPSPLLGLAAFAGVLWAGAGGGSRRSRRCPSCGATVCPRCRRRIKDDDRCPACWALGAGREGDAAEREKQEVAVRSWKERSRRWARVAAAALPGWGEWLAGSSSWRCPALGALWSLAGGALVLGVLHPSPLLPWGEAAFPWLAAGLVAAAHLLGLRGGRASRRRQR